MKTTKIDLLDDVYLTVEGKNYLLADGKELLKMFVAQKKAEDIDSFAKAKRKKELDINPGIYVVDPTDLYFDFETWCWNLIWETVKDDGMNFDAAADDINRHSDELLDKDTQPPCT